MIATAQAADPQRVFHVKHRGRRYAAVQQNHRYPALCKQPDKADAQCIPWSEKQAAGVERFHVEPTIAKLFR